jgi:hypothetical protein
MNKYDPAFPVPAVTGLPNGEVIYGFNGLTVRDYIAIQAMQGFLSADRFGGSKADLAYNAYIIADVMIAESQQSRGSDD